MYYLALVLDADDGLDFICPDVPGFTAHAPTKDFGEAVAVAREVLAGHLGVLLDLGGALPAAREFAALRVDPDFAEDFGEAITTVLLPALVPAGRAVRVNVSLDENTLQLIDSAAKDRSLTRSAFIAEASRQLAGGTSLSTAFARAQMRELTLKLGFALFAGHVARDAPAIVRPMRAALREADLLLDGAELGPQFHSVLSADAKKAEGMQTLELLDGLIAGAMKAAKAERATSSEDELLS